MKLQFLKKVAEHMKKMNGFFGSLKNISVVDWTYDMVIVFVVDYFQAQEIVIYNNIYL